jgi:hypothetical protein
MLKHLVMNVYTGSGNKDLASRCGFFTHYKISHYETGQIALRDIFSLTSWTTKLFRAEGPMFLSEEKSFNSTEGVK